MPGWRRCVVTLMVVVCPAAAADPGLLSMAPPDASLFLGASLSRLAGSPAARAAVTQAQSSQPQIRQFVQATGLDPLGDVREFLLASSADGKTDRGLVLIKGTFDAGKLAALAARSGGALSTYGGVQVVAGKKPSDGWVALLDGATAAFGDPESIRGAIDRRGAGRGPEPRLRARIDELSNTYDLWALSAAPLSDLPQSALSGQLGGLMQGDILKAVEMAGGGIRFGADLLIVLEAVSRTDKDAAALADVARFLAGMAQLNAQKDPKAADSLQFLSRFQVTAAGNVTRMSLNLHTAEMEKLIRRSQAPAARQGVTIQSSPRDMGAVEIR